MTTLTNRCYRLRRRPDGPVTEDDLEFIEEPVPTLEPGQALIRTIWLSIDPANRIWMSNIHYSLPPVPIDGVMRGIGIGQVVHSRREDLSPGQLVSGFTGWADYSVADTTTDDTPFTVLPSPPPAPLNALLGPLGNTGFTAYFGVHDIGKPRSGETMVVSAAAGAVGSIAGQIGKARGARVVGIAGSEQKCRYVVDDLGFDACVNYKDTDWRERLAAATPDGIDIDFENVGGQVFHHVLMRLNVGGRVALCGLVSEYNTYGSAGEHLQHNNIAQVLMVKRALVKSFLVLDHEDRFPEAGAYLKGLMADNKLRYDQTIVEGLEHAREALNQLFDGSTTGKLLIKVADL
jgi:NADPH-dependent curcumin reductase CurA